MSCAIYQCTSQLFVIPVNAVHVDEPNILLFNSNSASKQCNSERGNE